jgi:hypothetical protein
MERKGKAMGMAWHGKEMHGMEWHGKARKLLWVGNAPMD